MSKSGNMNVNLKLLISVSLLKNVMPSLQFLRNSKKTAPELLMTSTMFFLELKKCLRKVLQQRKSVSKIWNSKLGQPNVAYGMQSLPSVLLVEKLIN